MILFIQLRNKSNLKFTCHNLKCTCMKREKSRTRNTDEMCWMPVGAMCLVPPSHPVFFLFLFFILFIQWNTLNLGMSYYICCVKTGEDMNKVKVYAMDVPVCCVWMILNATVYYCDPCFLVYYIRWGFVRYLIVCYRFIILGFMYEWCVLYILTIEHFKTF